MKKFKTILLIIILAFSAAAQQKTVTTSNLNSRLSNLEEYKSNIDNLSKIQSENLKKYVDDEIKKQMEKVDESKKILELLLYVGVPGTVISLIVVFVFSIGYTNKKIKKLIENIVESKKDSLVRLIETEAFDQKLLNTKELLVISGNEDRETEMKQFLRKLKFKKVKYHRIDDLDSLPEYDLMIFNTPDGTVDQATIDLLMQNSNDEDDCYVAYTKLPLNRDDRLNFSNSRFTLYHNILTTLKYAELIKIREDTEI